MQGLIATAFIESIRKGYTTATFRSDLGAAMVVSLVALPLSMALAIAVGLPPQHGLYTAIVAGIVTALLGGSKMQVTGPTAAFVAILAPIVTQYGLNGLIWCQLMAGGLLILMGLFQLGKYIEHVPYAVTTGFTSGIAVVIATLSLNDFLGLHIDHMGDHYIDKIMAIAAHLMHLTPVEAIVGIGTLLLIIGFARLTKMIPAPVAGIFGGTILSLIAMKLGLNADTIATRFTYILPSGEAGSGIPPSLPQFHLPEMISLYPLVVPAITVALLAALESLLSATVADNISEEKHNSNAELVGVGIGNLAAGFFAGIPATGAIARTAANIHAGAKTPIASALHGLFLLTFMMVLAKYISQIPMAALAALLLVTAWRMAHIPVFVDILRTGNRKETAILLVTFFLTIFADMVIGVGAGLILSWIFHITKR